MLNRSPDRRLRAAFEGRRSPSAQSMGALATSRQGNCAVHGERCGRQRRRPVVSRSVSRVPRAISAGGAESASDSVGFGGLSANDALRKGEVVTSGTTRRRPLMLGRLVLEPQHVGVWQELDPKFCGEVVPSSGQWASSRTPQVLHRVIHRTCGFSSACAQCDGSWNPADDRSEHCATRSYAYPAP